MAARPGEENVAVLFGDVHYFYLPRDVKPQHHRFDRSSYVYLFEDVSNSRCRVEIANYPGTENQDAFTGYLDDTLVRYSYKHHCMVSLTVADSVGPSEWHLPTFDLRNEKLYHYKLHSLDIYFWTQKDALRFVSGLRRVLPSSHMEVLDEPPLPSQPAQPVTVSPIVQKLETAAISDIPFGLNEYPAISQRSASRGLAASASGDVPAVLPSLESPGCYRPMIYNPAAPAAPETIRHRDKTPPPDDDTFNPLSVAVTHDLQGTSSTQGSLLSSQPGGRRVAGDDIPALVESIHQTAPVATTVSAPHQPMSQLTPPRPGCAPLSGANPSSQQSQSWQPSHDYSIHRQVYQSTDSGMHQLYHPKEPRGKLEEHAGRLERGVSGILKRFEKKFG
ncbi:hypothetical protein XA68_11282 [Ophiocordyceps unilateralis]|uniref:RNA recognition motif-containing protein n=1 Tax=Ophiocordyceps unilateralis TaxID=268505 RepID=A0A2A9P271_OPHUN|nr:hypothetical protein XA68_11282 [Ophiocordyceps unilateralis]